eukprot:12881462-Prorocentrum_lima.AAC.1
MPETACAIEDHLSHLAHFGIGCACPNRNERSHEEMSQKTFLQTPRYASPETLGCVAGFRSPPNEYVVQLT